MFDLLLIDRFLFSALVINSVVTSIRNLQKSLFGNYKIFLVHHENIAKHDSANQTKC